MKDSSSSTGLVVGVTGATGFVGGAVCRALQQQGHKVRALTRRTVQAAVSGSTPVCEWVQMGDIGPQTEWERALEGLDVLVHCAAHVHQMGSSSDTGIDSYDRVNHQGSSHLASSAARFGVQRMVFLSSVKVLGETSPPGQPFQHVSKPHPSEPYGRSKWAAEQALQTITKETGLALTVIRPPLVYGPGVGANFAALIRLVRSGWPLPLASIDNRRSMVGLGNLVDLIGRCVVQTEAVGQSLLVSDNEDLSTPELIRHLALALGTSAKLFPVPVQLLRLAGTLTGYGAQVSRLTESLQVDVSYTCSQLGWCPPHSVAEELARTVHGMHS